MMETLDIDKDGNLVMEDFIRMRFLKDDKIKGQQTFQKIFEKKNNSSHLLILSPKNIFGPRSTRFENFIVHCHRKMCHFIIFILIVILITFELNFSYFFAQLYPSELLKCNLVGNKETEKTIAP